MGAKFSPGFTIIETMLFLSVTGLLVVGVLVGVGTSLNNQRYRDSVESFKDLVQSQYSEIDSVRNSRADNLSCNSSANVSVSGPANPAELRGQSNCFIVGRYVIIEGKNVSTYTVVGRQTGATNGLSDISSLKSNYAFNISADSLEDDTLDWGSQLAWPTSGSGAKNPATPRSIGILVIRSPETGEVYTFTSDTVPSDEASISNQTFKDIIVAGTGTIPGQSGRTLCVQSSGAFPGGDMAVYISEYASSASAIEVRSNTFMASQGITTKC